MPGVGEFLSGVAQSEQTSNGGYICTAGLEIFERAPHNRASIDHIIHDCDACPLNNVAQLASGSKYVRAALGLHPELVHSHRHELEQFRRYLPQTRHIGEVGLDYTTPDKDIRQEQRRILATIAGWADGSEDKVLTVHFRRAAGDVLNVLNGIKARKILHWFSGTYKELDRAIAEGYFFSINGAMM